MQQFTAPPITSCTHCGAPRFSRKENTTCCNKGQHLYPDPDLGIVDVCDSKCSRKTACIASREMNSELALGIIHCESITFATGFGNHNRGNNGPTMLYLGGAARALPKQEHYLYVRDVLAFPHSNEISETIRTVAEYLKRNNALYAHAAARGSTQFNRAAAVRMVMDNAPRDDREIGIIIPATAIQANVYYDGTVYTSDSELMEPLLYPMLFPTGNAGWSPRDGRFQWYIRAKMFQSRLCKVFGRVSSQWLLHSWSRWRTKQSLDALNFADQRKKINRRLTTYAEYCAARNTNTTIIGRLACLPSTVPHSVLQNRERINDMTVVVARKGPIDFFVTFTCSAAWEEILALLAEYGLADCELHNHVDIVSRAFKIRNDDLRKIISDGFFGVADDENEFYLFQTVEFQKRLFPHSHTLIRSGCSEQVIMSRIDDIVSCRIPDDDDELRALVLGYMKHTCSDRCFQPRRPNAPRLKQCKYNFPKPKM